MNLGLVLSGGGIRGIAHIGALKAMEEYNLNPTHISGTSAGAVVGGLYAAGIDWSEILYFLKTLPIFHRKRYAFNKPGFIDSEKFYKELSVYLPKDNFNALKLVFFVTATNVLDGSLKIFHKGELIRPILASASFPGVFSPVEIEGSYYIDGGIYNNFPVEPLIPICDKIIGIYVSPLKRIVIDDLKHSYDVIERAYKIKSVADSIVKFKHCDMVISPVDLGSYGTFNMKNIDTIFELGYTETRRVLDEHMEAVMKE
jgi:NTE family protein